MLSLKHQLGARELPRLRVAERKRILYEGQPLIFFISLVPFALRHHGRTLAAIPAGQLRKQSQAQCDKGHIMGVTRDECGGGLDSRALPHALSFPKFFAKWMFTFSACGAGGRIEPGV